MTRSEIEHSIMRKCPFCRLLTIALVAFAAGALPTNQGNAATSKAPSKNTHLERAVQLRAADDAKGAVIELKNALQKDPENAEARLLLGEIYVALGNGAAAEKELLRAQNLGIDAGRRVELLGEARLLLRKFRDVLSQVQVRRDDPPARKAALHILRGWAHRGLGEIEAARKAFEAALTLAPNDLDALLSLGRTTLAQKDAETSGEILSRAQQLAPYDSDVLAFEGAVAYAREDFAASATALAQAVANRPGSPGLLVALARAHLLGGKPNKALAPLTEALEINDGIYIAYYFRALALYELKDYKQAESAAREALTHAQNYVPAYFIRGAARFAQGKFQAARDDLRLYVKVAPDHAFARKLLAEANLRSGQAGEAYNAARALVEQDPEDKALLNLAGVSAIRKNDLISGRAYLEEFVRKDPKDSVARARLGWIRFALGDFEAGLDDLERAVDFSSKMPYTEFKVIRQYIAKKWFDDALAAARRYQRRHANDSTGIVLEAIILLAQGKADAATALLREAQATRPGDRRIAHFLATVAMQRRRFDEARALYNQVVRRTPGHAPTLLALWRLERGNGNRDAAKDWLKKAREALDAALRRNSDDAAAGLLREEIALGEQDLKIAGPLILALEKTTLVNPRVIALTARLAVIEERHDDAVRAYQRLVNLRQSTGDVLRLASVQWRAKQTDAAVATLSNWLKRFPANNHVHFILGAYYLQLRNWVGAQRIYATLVENIPNHAVARNNLAWSLFQLGELDAALEQATRASELAPDNKNIQDTLNKIRTARGIRPTQ